MSVRVHGFGAPPRVEDVPDPTCPPGHTSVQIAAATVGHIDRSIWSGSFLRHPPLPYTPGVEASGMVVESARFAPGERVWVRGGGLGTARDGTWAERAVAPDEVIGALPDGVDFGTGSVFFSPCTSAWIALHSIGQVSAGQTVLVTGATGAVGSIAVQLAAEAGACVVGSVSHPDRLGDLPDGVEGIVTAPDIRDVCPPVDLVIDTVGGAVLQSVVPAVTPGGTVVLVGYVAGAAVTLDLPMLIQHDVTLRPLNMIHREPEGRAVAAELLARISDGRLTIDVTSFGFDQASEALDWVASSGHRGRAVLVPDGAPR